MKSRMYALLSLALVSLATVVLFNSKAEAQTAPSVMADGGTYEFEPMAAAPTSTPKR